MIVEQRHAFWPLNHNRISNDKPTNIGKLIFDIWVNNLTWNIVFSTNIGTGMAVKQKKTKQKLKKESKFISFLGKKLWSLSQTGFFISFKEFSEKKEFKSWIWRKNDLIDKIGPTLHPHQQTLIHTNTIF